MSSIAARRANKRACQWQPNGIPIVSTRGRRRQVHTSRHFCPNPACRYGGWLGLGNMSANGHPGSGPWRQLHCTSCGGYFPRDPRNALAWQACGA